MVSNARCLTEGVDVPALDAILFLYPRRSVIDVVQAVGRVMRKAKGKKFGYIILPIAREPGKTAEETLKDSKYKHVWQVLNALKSHDDRFEAEINHLALTEGRPDTPYPDRPGDIGESTDEVQALDVPEWEAVHGSLHIVGDEGFQKAIRAKVVDKYADPNFWRNGQRPFVRSPSLTRTASERYSGGVMQGCERRLMTIFKASGITSMMA